MHALRFFLSSCVVATLALAGCSTDGDNHHPQQHKVLSDLDRDGYFASAECDDPRPEPPSCGGPHDDGEDPTGPNTPDDEPGVPGTSEPGGTGDGCVVVPGPTDCVYLEDTGDGCYQCLDAAGQPTGDATCTNPVTCEVDPTGDDGTGPVCWTCTDGDVTYHECYTPPAYCETDADCATGQTCAIPEIDCAPGEECPAIAAVGVCVGAGPDDPVPPTEPGGDHPL